MHSSESEHPQKHFGEFRGPLQADAYAGINRFDALRCRALWSGRQRVRCRQRLLARAVKGLGGRFADYLVVDGEFATAPFLHASGRAGVPVAARLEDDLPELLAAVEKRSGTQPPPYVYRDGEDRVEIWDDDDFDPWETLDWETVRVIRYRQHKPDGSMVQADWLTNIPTRKASGLSLYHMAKSRWEIENQGFNEAKDRYGIEHICHHEANSILLNWLITFLALVI